MKDYKGLEGSWDGKIENLFLIVTRCLENLSSGEKRADEAHMLLSVQVDSPRGVLCTRVC